jgi:Flp pilus assembly protein protease CpaA
MTNIIILIAIIILLYIGYSDFKYYKITNMQLSLMLLLFIIWKILYFNEYFWLDMKVGLVLFIIGFVAWLARGIGAGDAKLFFIAGIFSGYEYAGYFAIFLFISGLSFMFLTLIVRRFEYMPVVLFGRLVEIGKTKKVPYGVPLAASTIGALIIRLNS